jgi:surface antigen
MSIKTRTLIALIIFSLSACSTLPYTHEQQGRVGGAGVGAIVGFLFCQNIDNPKLKIFCLATFTGMGLIVGGAMGEQMDESDQQEVMHALQTLPDNEKHHWTNSRTGTEFTIQPISTHETSAQICRDYEIWMTREGNTQEQKDRQCVDYQ